MRAHRFCVSAPLSNRLKITDRQLVHQWRRVLRIPVGGEVRLFDGRGHECRYAIEAYDADTAALLVSLGSIPAQIPKREVTLFFSLLKKDKSEWVIQKCTEIGVSRFVPVISKRTEKIGYSYERMKKIAIEAAEQCGRGDIPEILEPMLLSEAIRKFTPRMQLLVCEEEGEAAAFDESGRIGCFVGPEGGWTDTEKAEFADSGVRSISLGEFTLRAETACVVVAALSMRVQMG